MSATRLGLLAALLATAGGVGLISLERVRDQLAVMEACEAVGEGDWAAALSGTEQRVGADATGRAAAECRCLALLATGAGDACADLLEQVLSDPEVEAWAPRPELAVHLIQTRRDQGRARAAAELARRATRRHPQHTDLFYLELVTRASVEDEEAVLRELETRLAGHAPHELHMRASLANRYLLRGDPQRALAALGELAPRDAAEAPDPSRAFWFDTRGMALAFADDLAGLQESYRQWREAGGEPAELRARYALTLSIAGLADPEHTPIELLQRALEDSEPLSEPALHEALAIRLILTLVNAERLEEALAVYDRSRERFELAGLAREEIERSAAHQLLARAPAEQRIGELDFAIPDPAPGSRLLLSPGPDAAVDADYESLPVPASGRVAVQRALGTAPQRWVYRDARGRVLASGSVSPAAGRAVKIEVSPRAPLAPLRSALHRSPPDGRRRIAMIVLDCGDWRLLQYLRARGELPFLDALIRTGYRAVLDSDPPLTAAALEALVAPEHRGAASFVGLLNQLGVELAGLASIGENPLAGLAWILPEGQDLFERVGAGELSAANLLFAHGGIRAGRHSEITGPNGERRRVPLAKSARDLDASERARWPALAAVRRERDAVHLRTIAAEFDTAAEIVRAREVDLLALRIEPLDILTHAHFAQAVRDGQDDGEGLLFSVYRYIDARLQELHDLLDADDTLIAMSDHGIRTAMEHSRHAFFAAAGPGLPAGRAQGSPSLRGVPRVVAELLGLSTDWPDTGLAPRALASAEPSRLAVPRPKADSSPARTVR